MYKLIIAEKPSVAKDYANALGASSKKNGYFEGNGFRVSWCIGHLIGLSYPEKYDPKYKRWTLEDLPILPEELLTEPLPNTIVQYESVKALMLDDNVEYIVNGTDAGREGELIFRLVYNLSGSKKPVKRLWVSSMTEEAILGAFEKLQDSIKYDNLYNSAISRAEADWLVGLNGTRLYSKKYNETLSVGRVQTPVLAMIVNRHNDISNFKSSPYFELEIDYGSFKGIWIDKDGNRKIDNQDHLKKITDYLSDSSKVKYIEEKNKRTNPPLLYDLTLLQREANRKYKMSANDTLSAAQALYEKYKLTTYPRTDSNYLSEDMVSQLPGILKNLSKLGYDKEISELLKSDLHTNLIINNSKVTDHHAIIPTGKIVDMSILSVHEKSIFELILTRFITVFYKPFEYKETIVYTENNGELFISKGRQIIEPGWTHFSKNDNEETDTQNLPLIKKDDILKVMEIYSVSKKTSPPKNFSEDTLLSAMEKCNREIDDGDLKEALKDKGIGTVATRAAIIEKLIEASYIERMKGSLVPTQKGILLISLVDEKLKSVELTGEWEYQLNRIAAGEVNRNDFMRSIRLFTNNLVNEVIGRENSIQFKELKRESNTKELIGSCPRCHMNVYESEKSFYCEGFKNDPKCSFSISKNNKWFEARGKNLTKTVVKQLLKSGRSSIQKFKKKAGGEYEAHIILKDDGRFVSFDIEFPKK